MHRGTITNLIIAILADHLEVTAEQLVSGQITRAKGAETLREIATRLRTLQRPEARDAQRA